MSIDNEELLQKFVRTGMIMRHIDGEEPHGHHKHGHGYGKGKGRCCHGRHGEEEARIDGEAVADRGYGHESRGARGPEGHGHEGHGRGARGLEGCCHEGHDPRGHGKRCGKRRGQARVITMVAMKEGINQKDLAFLLGIRPQTLGEMLRRLEERGLVERKKSEADARAIQVYLTDEGRARAQEIAERRALAAADLFSVLTDEEKEQLASILDKLATELDKYRPRHHHDAEPNVEEPADELPEQE